MAISFAQDIRPLFTDEDIDHMSSYLDLSSLDDNKQNSASILQHLKGEGGFPRMPPPPRAAWSPQNISLYQQWVAEGCQP